ncbi:MAG: sulfotransferase family 2 domain-containing protein [bacterium]
MSVYTRAVRNALRPGKRLKYALAWSDHKKRPVKENVLVYVHIPKCGGTTLSEAMRANYNPWRILSSGAGRHRPDGGITNFEEGYSPETEYVKRTLKKMRDYIECFTGHVPYGVHKHIERECQYVSFVRDPVKRVWSGYNYDIIFFGGRSKVLRKYGMDIRKALEDEYFPFCNDQTRMLLGSPDRDLGPDAGERVIEHIEKNFYFIDVLDRFEQGLHTLINEFGWKNIEYKDKNVSEYEKVPGEPDEDIVELIREKNRHDIKLYEYLLKREPKINS